MKTKTPVPNLIVEVDRENIRHLNDIVDRKRAEEAHQQIAERYKRQSHVFDAMLSALTDFAYIFDRDGRFLYANSALVKLWGLTLEAVIGGGNCRYRIAASALRRKFCRVF